MHNTGWEDSHLCGVSQQTASKGYFGDSSGKHILHINNAFCKPPKAWRQRAPAWLSDRALRALPLKEGGCFISLKVWQLVLAPELVPRTNGGSKNECPYSVDTDVAKDEQR